MGMQTVRRSGRVAGEINVTPMIDVLLVLLVIFMVVQQGMQRGLPVVVPGPDPTATTPGTPDALVLEVEPGGRYRLNRQAVAAGGLQDRLREVFAERPRSVLFVRGAGDATYGEVVHALDASRAAGVEVLAFFPGEPGG